MFNVVGYRGWFYIAEYQWKIQLQNSLDKEQYNHADLITIRTPLPLPYITDTRDFQRIDGEVKVNGKIYHYVKRKIENGEYVLLCLPDHHKQKLEKAKEDFFKASNDVLQNGSSKKSGNSKSGIIKNLLSEYNACYITFNHAVITTGSYNYNLHSVPKLLSAPDCSPLQPPELG
jgi:hypothetical protein